MAVRNKYEPTNYWATLLQRRGCVLANIWSVIAGTILVALGITIVYEFNIFNDWQGEEVIRLNFHRTLLVPFVFLLYFRSQIGYGRYWEGRGVISGYVRHSRELVRQCCGVMRGDDLEGQWFRQELRRLLMVLLGIIFDFSCGQEPAWDYSSLLDSEVAALKEEPLGTLVPTYAAKISALLGKARAQGRVDDLETLGMENSVAAIVASWSAAMKIRNTPMPFPYVQMLNTYLLLFVYSIPFATVHRFRWATPVVTALIAIPLFGINAIGVEVENPFGSDVNDFNLPMVENAIYTETLVLLQFRDPLLPSNVGSSRVEAEEAIPPPSTDAHIHTNPHTDTHSDTHTHTAAQPPPEEEEEEEPSERSSGVTATLRRILLWFC